MRIKWDEAKREVVLKKRRIDFADLDDLLYTPYVEDRRSNDPDQYRIIGLAEQRFLTFIVEYREDELGEFLWVVTAWKSTKQEIRTYEQETK
jgi:uncharacterized DUF497 family protein